MTMGVLTFILVFIVGAVYNLSICLILKYLLNIIPDMSGLSCLVRVYVCVRSRVKQQVGCAVSSPQIEQISIY